jgi:hypothetical protein
LKTTVILGEKYMKKKKFDWVAALKDATCVILKPADRKEYSVADQLRAITPKKLSPKSKDILAEYHRKYLDKSNKNLN